MKSTLKRGRVGRRKDGPTNIRSLRRTRTSVYFITPGLWSQYGIHEASLTDSRMASFARSTANRAVHLRITPRPSNLGESREILRLISQFGEVEYFKNLKYDTLTAPNAALVIYRDEDAAQTCMKRSPIRFRMGPASEEEEVVSQTKAPAPAPPPEAPQAPLRGPVGTPFGLGQSRSMSSIPANLPRPPRKEPAMPFIGEDEPTYKPTSRIFQLQANSARAQFRDLIDLGHYHGSFAIDTKSAIQDDLGKRVPMVGLSAWDWRAKEKPWRIMRREKEQEREGPGRRKSLRELYEEGPAAHENDGQPTDWKPVA